jgi:hypothetical protein
VYLTIPSMVRRPSRPTETDSVTARAKFIDARPAQTSYFDFNDPGATAICTDAAFVLQPERVILGPIR